MLSINLVHLLAIFWHKLLRGCNLKNTRNLNIIQPNHKTTMETSYSRYWKNRSICLEPEIHQTYCPVSFTGKACQTQHTKSSLGSPTASPQIMAELKGEPLMKNISFWTDFLGQRLVLQKARSQVAYSFNS